MRRSDWLMPNWEVLNFNLWVEIGLGGWTKVLEFI